MSGTLPSWEESFVLKQVDGDSTSSDTFDYRQLTSSLWRSEGKDSLRMASSDIQLSVDNKQGSLSTKYPDRVGSIGLLSALDRALLGRDDGNRSVSSAFQSKQLISSTDSGNHHNDSGSQRNIQSLNKFDANDRGKYISIDEGKQRTQPLTGLKTANRHVDRSVSVFSAQKIPHEVGVSEGKEVSEQKNVLTAEKAVPALQNHNLEFLPTDLPTSTSSSSSTKEEKNKEKIIHSNLSECKKVIKYLLKCLKGIKLSVDNDGDIKSKVPDFYVEYETNSRYSLYIHSDDNWHNDLNDLDGEDEQESVEARSRVVRQESKQLLGAFRESLTAIFDCCETRKAAYVAQIKKIREVSNLATRNAMQTERLAGDSQIKHVTEMVETSQRRALDEAQRKLLESERTNRNLDIELQHMKNTLETYAVRDQRRLENQKQAVDEALRAQRESFEEASKQQLQLMQEEARRAARDAAAQIEASNNNSKIRLEAQKAHEDEMKVIFAAERERIEDECKKLRQQLVAAAAETFRERERAAARSQEDRDRFDKLQQEFAQESSAIKAQMQQQIVKILQDHQAEKNKMEGDLDTRMENFKQSILTAHALDIAKLQDSTLAEMKRIKAEAEVRHQEDTRRVRHLHEQEMQRLLRENDRLRKIIIRNGGSSSFSYDASSKQSPVMRTSFEERIRQGRSKSPAGAAATPTSMSVSMSASSSKGNTTATRRTSRKSSKASTETSASAGDHIDTAESSSSGNSLNKSTAYSPPSSPAPPPPPPSATNNPSTGNVLDWTTVRQSINDQHKILQQSGTSKKEPSRYSIGEARLAVSSPPSTFPLDESLFASKRSSSSSSTSSSSLSRTTAAVDMSTASLNAARVGTYMSRLEEYLEGSQVAIPSASFLRQRDSSASASNGDENDDDDDDSNF